MIVKSEIHGNVEPQLLTMLKRQLGSETINN